MIVLETDAKEVKQAGAELPQAQPVLRLEDRVFRLWLELES